MPPTGLVASTRWSAPSATVCGVGTFVNMAVRLHASGLRPRRPLDWPGDSELRRCRQGAVCPADHVHQGRPAQAHPDLGGQRRRSPADDHPGKVVEGQANSQHAAGHAGHLRHAGTPEKRGHRRDRDDPGHVADRSRLRRDRPRVRHYREGVQPVQQAARRHEEQRRPRSAAQPESARCRCSPKNEKTRAHASSVAAWL